MLHLHRPEVTLIIASSVDGCLVSRDSDELDYNKSWKNSNHVRGIIYQFFDFIKNNQVYNLTTAESLAKLGFNSHKFIPKKNDIRIIVIDLKNKLTPLGIANLAKSVQKLIVIVSPSSPLQPSKLPSNCQVQPHKPVLDLQELMEGLKRDYNIQKVTIQSAGLMNARWLAAGVVDFLTVIVYPLLVSHNGAPILGTEDVFSVKPLRLLSTGVFDGNYVSLQYYVINEPANSKENV